MKSSPLAQTLSNPAMTAAALLLLRLTTAGVLLYHGIPKAIDPGMAFDKFVGFGFPGFLGPVTGVLEVVCGIGLVVGFYSRLSALVMAVVIGVAIATVTLFSGNVAAIERDVLLFAGLFAIVTVGGGPWQLRAPEKSTNDRTGS